jgi:MarR family
MPETIETLRRLISKRLGEIEAEIKQLERAAASMGEGGGRRSEAPKTRRKSGAPKRRSGSRAKRGQRQGELLAAIEIKPGVRPAELADEIGIPQGQVSVLLAKARAEKLVIKKGKGYERQQ